MSVVRLLVLGVVRLRGSAHGYAVLRELTDWQVETWTSVKPGSIYHALKQLSREGLLVAVGSEAGAGGPARTLYRLTDSGISELDSLLEEALKTVHLEWFSAGIAFMQLFPRDRVLALLRERRNATILNHDHLVALVPTFPDRNEPPHTADLLGLWSGVLAATVTATGDLIARIEAGEYRFAGETS